MLYFLKKMSRMLILLIAVVFLCTASHAFVGAGRYAYELSAPIIKTLAQLGKAKGSGAVAKELAAYAMKLPPAQLRMFYEANYAKILLAQNRITKLEMDEWLRNLRNVKGFRSTLSKMCGQNTSALKNSNAIGHGFELKTANALAKNRFKVVSLGERFNDGIKQGVSDIDLVAQKGGRTYAFELKNYDNPFVDAKSLGRFKDDFITLQRYASENPGTVPVFLIRNRPSNDAALKLIDEYSKAYDVKVIYGEASSAVKILEKM